MRRNKKATLLRLQGCGRPFTGGDTGLVWRTLVESGDRLPNFTRQLLQPDWSHVDAQTGMSFLHAVVDKVARGGRYTEAMAVADVKELAGSRRPWRCSVLYRDPGGKTALDRVVDMGQQFPALRGELSGKHAAQAKKPELCQAARDMEQGWLQVQQNQ